SAEYSSVSLADIATTRDAAQEFIQAIPHYVEEVAVAMVPICLMFLLFQLATRRFKRMQLLRIVSGLIYTYLGLVLFLTGVNVGFMPAGQLIGATVASGDRSEEHTSELQSRFDLVCRLLLEKKKRRPPL